MSEDAPPAWTPRGLVWAGASGAFATIALGLSPYGSQVPPLVIPRTFIDLRFVFLPLFFVSAHVAMARSSWPYPALVLPALALSAAASAHFQGSAVLDFVTDLEGTEEGTRVDLAATLASGASLLLALAAGLERARDRLVAHARAAGVSAERLEGLRAFADGSGRRALGFAAATFVALAFVARIGDVAFGESRAPLPEILGAVLAVGVAALLFPGVFERARLFRVRDETGTRAE